MHVQAEVCIVDQQFPPRPNLLIELRVLASPNQRVVVFEVWLVFLSERLLTWSPEKDSSPRPTCVDFDEPVIEGQNLAINTMLFFVL